MKKVLGIALALFLLTVFVPETASAQEEYVKELFDGYFKELKELNDQIVTAEDAERLENKYKAHIKQIEACYSTYSEIIMYQKNLHEIYVDYTDLYDQIGKRIEELKAAKAQQEVIDKLTVKFDAYLASLVKMEERAKRYKDDLRIDSLNLVKKEAEEYFNNEATAEYNSNRAEFEADEQLTAKWNSIKESYTRISSTDIVKIDKDKGDKIFKIIMSAVMVFIALNMMTQKLKIKKQIKKAQAPAKDDTPSI